MKQNMVKIYTNADTAPILSALGQSASHCKRTKGVNKGRERYNNGLLDFDRSLPENPALIKASLSAGISRRVKIQAARVKPRDACNGWPSLLRIKAPAATRPERVNIHSVNDIECDAFTLVDMSL
jgi:hypothetical protein